MLRGGEGGWEQVAPGRHLRQVSKYLPVGAPTGFDMSAVIPPIELSTRGLHLPLKTSLKQRSSTELRSISSEEACL